MTRGSAGRLAAAAVVAVTIGLNIGTLWTFFATDFMDRFGGLGITDVDRAILDAVIIEFAAVTGGYVSVGFLLAGRPGAGRIAAVLLAGGVLFAATPFGYSVGAQLVFHAHRASSQTPRSCSVHWPWDRATC